MREVRIGVLTAKIRFRNRIDDCSRSRAEAIEFFDRVRAMTWRLLNPRP